MLLANLNFKQFCYVIFLLCQIDWNFGYCVIRQPLWISDFGFHNSKFRLRIFSFGLLIGLKKWNESGFRTPLCTYRLKWARRTSWGWWDNWDDTVLQTQDPKFEPWRSEVEHATSRSRRLPTKLTFTRGWGRNIFVSFKPPRPGTEPRTLAWKAAVLTTTLGPPPLIGLTLYFRLRNLDFRLQTLDFRHRTSDPNYGLKTSLFEHCTLIWTLDFRLRTFVFRLQILDFRLRIETSDFGLRPSDFVFWTSDFRFQTSIFRLQISDFQIWTSDFGQASDILRIRISDFAFWTLDLRHRILDLIFRTLEFGLGPLAFRLRISHFRLRIFRLWTFSDFRFRISDLNFSFWTSDFKVWTSELGFWTSDFRFRTSDFD